MPARGRAERTMVKLSRAAIGGLDGVEGLEEAEGGLCSEDGAGLSGRGGTSIRCRPSQKDASVDTLWATRASPVVTASVQPHSQWRNPL